MPGPSSVFLRCIFWIALTFPSFISAEAILPSPSGPYAVTHNTLKLTDESRTDPLDPNHGKRQLMISFFYPVRPSTCKQSCTIPYVPHNTAPHLDAIAAPFGIPRGTFDKIQLQVCCKTTGGGKENPSKVPIVLLLHGLGGTRLLHNALAQNLASAGFAVVTMDHTFESVAVEFPDGSVVLGLKDLIEDPLGAPERLRALQDIRTDDVRFVLSKLGTKDVLNQLVPGSSHGFNTAHAAVFGHSFGGSTAINLLMHDRRFVGGMNLDGTQWGEITDVQQPAVLFGTAGAVPHNSTTDATWAETVQHLKGWKAEIGLQNITHNAFMDVPFLYKAGALDLSDGAVSELIGTLDAGRSFEIITTYVATFLDFVLRGKNTTLFDGPSNEFPEIVVS